MAYKSIDSLEENSKDLFIKVTSLLLKLVENVLHNPTEPKYRKIRLGNERISQVVLPSIGGMECLFDMGFVEADDSLYLPTTTSMDKLKDFHKALKLKQQRVLGQPSAPKPGSTASAETGARQNREAETQRSVKVSKTKSEIFLDNLDMTSNNVCLYEDKQLQLKALSKVPVSRIETSTMEQVRTVQGAAMKEGVSGLCEASTYETVFLRELMKWFKTEFFTWVNSPMCSACKSSTEAHGYSTVPEELKYTNRVEVYYCTVCKKRELFPRYNDTRLLLETRRGRCGEWAQCFTLFCRAFKFDARLICDNSDHAWTEVYSSFQNRWLHCDPCECVLDKPLLYEKGWNKNLDYVIAFSCDGVYDVTWRYAVDPKVTMTRRSLMPEPVLLDRLNSLTQQRRQGISERRKKYLSKRHVIELVEFLSPPKDMSGEVYEGRISGSLAWRLARGEIPTDLVVSSSFVWKPSLEEISAGKMVVKYDPVRDIYENETGTKSIKAWDKGAFQTENIFRKEELDWKNVYLCRTEGSKTGVIVWKFQVESPDTAVDSVEICFQTTTFKTGSVRLTLCGGNTCIAVNQGETPFKTNDFKGETELTLRAELLNGEGDVAWQHAQLFRVSSESCDSRKTYPLHVAISLSRKTDV